MRSFLISLALACSPMLVRGQPIYNYGGYALDDAPSMLVHLSPVEDNTLSVFDIMGAEDIPGGDNNFMSTNPYQGEFTNTEPFYNLGAPSYGEASFGSEGLMSSPSPSYGGSQYMEFLNPSMLQQQMASALAASSTKAKFQKLPLIKETLPSKTRAPIMGDLTTNYHYIDQNIYQPRLVTKPIVQQRLVEQPILRTRLITQPIIRTIATQPVVRPHLIETTKLQPKLIEQPVVQPHIIYQDIVQQQEVTKQVQNKPVVKKTTVQYKATQLPLQSSKQQQTMMQQPLQGAWNY